MAKPLRSPLVGYNHNLTHLGRVFHVQTEDSGPLTPRLFTHLFFEGTILASRKHEYDAGLPEDQVRTIMQTQHKTVMKDLLRARLDSVIIPFFGARGIDLVPVQGAVPAAPLSETPGPVMVLPSPAQQRGGGPTYAPRARAPSEPIPHAPPEYVEGSDAQPQVAATVDPSAGPRRTSTRSIETSLHHRGATPTPVVVRAQEGRRSPFVRSGAPSPSRLSSADGVVVQRNVVVGAAGAPASSRNARIRPPVPYVVTGGGHTERPPRQAPASAAPQTAAPGPGTSPPAAAQVAGPRESANEAVPRLSGGFGLGLPDDKSLDEVILEYLSDDGESG